MNREQAQPSSSPGNGEAIRLRPARTLWQRLRGLMWAPPLPPGEALWFPACAAVHTAFVRAPIDLLFLRGERIIRVCDAVPPWRIAAYPGADSVVELRAGEAKRRGLAVGGHLNLATDCLHAGRAA
jgi:uncharacterized protein